MASRNAFTEEGRTRFRNFQRRIKTYFMLWIVIALGANRRRHLSQDQVWLPAATAALLEAVRQSLNQVISATQEAFQVHPTGSRR